MDDKRPALRAVRFLRQALLSTTPSVLSCAVSRLETRLGWQLLRRTTRRMGLAAPGRLYLGQVRTASGLLDDAERDVQRQAGALAGRVRLSVPTTYGPLPPAARAGALCAAVPAGAGGTEHHQPQRGPGGRRLRPGHPPGPAARQWAGGAQTGRRPAVAGGRAGLPATPLHAADAGRSAAAPVPALPDAPHRAVGTMGVSE